MQRMWIAAASMEAARHKGKYYPRISAGTSRYMLSLISIAPHPEPSAPHECHPLIHLRW